MPKPREYHVRCFSYPNDRESIESAYRDLEHQLGPSLVAFQTWAWFLHHVTGPSDADTPQAIVVVVRRRESTCAVLPFRGPVSFKVGKFPLRALTTLYEKLNVSCAPCIPGLDFQCLLREVFRALLSEIKGWDVVVFPYQVPESPFYSIGGVFQGFFAARRLGPSIHWIATKESYQDYTQRLSKNFRNNLKKSSKRLASHNVDFEKVVGSRAAIADAAEEFYRLEASGWKKLTDQRLPAFRVLMAHAAAEGWARVDLLRVDGKVAAATLSLMKPPDRMYVYKIAYDEQLGIYSPGIILTDHLIRECLEREDITSFDLTSDAKWHLPFKPGSYELCTSILFRPSWRSLIGASALLLVGVLRRCISRK